MTDLPYLQPDRLFFSSFDDKSLKGISVKCITNPVSLDRIGTPLPGKFLHVKGGPKLVEELISVICCRSFAKFAPSPVKH